MEPHENIALAGYRLEKAKNDLSDAQKSFSEGMFETAANRAYYAIFHALRSVTALDHFDSGKHSGIIAYFNRNYVKTGVFDREISKLIDSSYRLREKADYDDFFLVARDDAAKQFEKARQVIDAVERYVQTRTEE